QAGSRARPRLERRELAALRRDRPGARVPGRPGGRNAGGPRASRAPSGRRSAAVRVTDDSRNRPWEIHAALAGAQAGLALFPILGKLVLVSIPPLLFAAFRAASAAILLEAFRRAQKSPEKIRRADAPRLVLYGLLGVSFNQILFIEGLSRTTAINTTVLTTT